MVTDVTPEKRAKWRKDAEQGTTFGATGDIRRILALLGALDAAEARVAAAERETLERAVQAIYDRADRLDRIAMTRAALWRDVAAFVRDLMPRKDSE